MNFNSRFWTLIMTAILLISIPARSWGQSGCSACPDFSGPTSGELAEQALRPGGQQAAAMWRELSRAWREKDWARVEPAADAIVQAFPGTVWEARARGLKGLFTATGGSRGGGTSR